eukprot:1366110-Amorphochlora_amoeboformis.AAC.1
MSPTKEGFQFTITFKGMWKLENFEKIFRLDLSDITRWNHTNIAQLINDKGCSIVALLPPFVFQVDIPQPRGLKALTI